MDVSIVIFFFGAVESFCDHDKKEPSYISATTNISTRFKVASSVKEYFQNGSKPLEKIKKKLQKGITFSEDFSIPFNSTPVNRSQISKASFKGGKITYVKVLEQFNFDGSNEIPVLISTTWSQHDLAKSINHTSEELAQSVLDGNILNVTMSLEWKTGYKELGKDKSTPRGETVEKFSKIWKRSGIPEFTNGQISVATNNKSSVYPCGVVIEGLTKQACEDDSWPKITYVHPLEKFLPFDQKWYQFDTKPTASGITSNISYGFNRTGNTYFINFTVLFSIWTFDFPNGFLYNYRDQSFVNEKTMLEIFYWKTEVVKPECPLPTYLPTIFYLMIGPATVLVLSLVLRLLTCSKHAFNIKVWQFKNKNKNVDEVFSEWKKKSQRIAKEKNQERARDMLRKDGFDLDYVGPEKQI